MSDRLIAWVDRSGIIHVDDPKAKANADPTQRTLGNLKLIIQNLEALGVE